MLSPTISVPVTDGLRAERALLDGVERGEREAGVVLWRAQDRALVVPRGFTRVPRYAYASEALASVGWPVVVRDTGGDVVPQSPGVVNVAIAFVLDRAKTASRPHIEYAYDLLCRPLIEWLETLGLRADVGHVAGAFCDGRFNVTVDGKKVAGTAQRWRAATAGRWVGRSVVLAHAALLVQEEVTELVDATNRVYRLSGVDKRCEVESHTTVMKELSRTGIDAGAMAGGLWRLEGLYRARLLGNGDF